MSRALIIEMSGRSGAIALAIDGKIAREEPFAHGLRNAAKVLPIIDQLTREQRWSPRDIDEIYISAGPGSFTGLRIAVTIAKSIALTTAAKIVAVPTVEVLSRNAPTDARNVVIVLDAKRNQIFTARFADGQLVEPAHLDSLNAILSRAPRPVHLVGEGIPFHEQFIPKADASVIVTPPECGQAQARFVSEIGWNMARRSQFTEADQLTPIYIRLPEAEEKWNRDRGIA